MGDAEAKVGHGGEESRGWGSPRRHDVDGAWERADGIARRGIDDGVEDHGGSAEVSDSLVGYGRVDGLGRDLQQP